VITDDFGQRVQMSADQFAVLIEEARSGRLDQAVAELIASLPARGRLSGSGRLDEVAAGLVEGLGHRVLREGGVAGHRDQGHAIGNQIDAHLGHSGQAA
jgi:hypothetical protein